MIRKWIIGTFLLLNKVVQKNRLFKDPSLQGQQKGCINQNFFIQCQSSVKRLLERNLSLTLPKLFSLSKYLTLSNRRLYYSLDGHHNLCFEDLCLSVCFSFSLWVVASRFLTAEQSPDSIMSFGEIIIIDSLSLSFFFFSLSHFFYSLSLSLFSNEIDDVSSLDLILQNDWKKNEKTIYVRMKKTYCLFSTNTILTKKNFNKYFLYLADIENYLSFDANIDFRSISKFNSFVTQKRRIAFQRLKD